MDTVWTAAGSPYEIIGSVGVASGKILTVLPGTTVKFGNASELVIAGTLISNGTATNPILFTGTPGQNWNAVRFVNSISSSLTYSVIENATFAVFLDQNSTPVIKNCIFRNNRYVVSDEGGYQPMTVDDCSFINNEEVFFGIRTEGQSFFRRNLFQGNSKVFSLGYYFGTVQISENSFLGNGFVLRAPEVGFGYGTVSMQNNFWGTTDLASIGAFITDQKDNVLLQSINVSPVLAAAPPGVGGQLFATLKIPIIESLSPTQSVQEGSSATLSVTAKGVPNLSFQWRKDGQTVLGATNSSLTFSSLTLSNTGSYSVVVSNIAGTTTSSAIILTVVPNTTAPQFTTQPLSQMTNAGSNVLLSATATGSPSPSFQWFKNGAPVSGATNNTLLLSSVGSIDRGAYSVVISNSAGSVVSSSAILTVNPASALTNLSIRTIMAAGQTLIVGAVVAGGAKDILLRASGPALSKFGLVGMNDPRLELYSENTLVGENDNWSSTISSTFTSLGAFSFDAGSRDSAILRPLNGAFTVQAKGTGPGTILVEGYDATGGLVPRLINVSARNFVGSGSDILIAGFAINGTGTKQLLIRAIGPSLSTFGIPGFLADPKLQVFNSASELLGENDNWDSSLSPIFSTLGAFPLGANSKDSALLITVSAAGTYTVWVSGADGGTGEALIEIYEVF